MSCCIYCGADQSRSSFLPPTHFNQKTFYYKECLKCDVVFLDPRPEQQDFEAMYPPSYQNGIDKRTIIDTKLRGLRFPYQLHFDLIENHAGNKPKVLDYGCGAGNFIYNAIIRGYDCHGAEFGQEQVNKLQNEIPQGRFYTIMDLAQSGNTYDVIRLSNVLEHLDDPKAILSRLTTLLKPGGILLIEGPVEMNFSLAFFFRKAYFTIKSARGLRSSHPPTHLTFTNRKNQLSFFNLLNLQPLHYQVADFAWPFPESFREAKGKKNKVNALIAKASIAVSSMISGWGNTFIYAGKLRK